MLRAVHGHDGYPVRWHEPADVWLTPASMVAAWVVVDVTLLGHVVLEQHADGLHVGRLFVAVEARGRGVGDLLLATVEAAAAGRPLSLEVHATAAAAIARYERRGWRRTGTHVAGWRERDGTPACAHRYVAPVRPREG